MSQGPFRRPKLRLPRPKVSGPSPTIRLRLTVMYGLVFLVTGAVLLTIGYIVVRNNINRHHDIRAQLFHQLGLPPPHPAFGYGPNSPEAKFAHEVNAQFVNDTLNRLVFEYLFALGVMTMIAVGTGWWLAGRALRPLRAITATARRVSGENLGERIALSGPADELKELADTFDGMLGRLDGAFASQRHFVANASHELRTPLAIMRTEVDVALADPDASVGDLRAMGEALRETIDRCERLIASLLLLARSEAAAGREEPVDLVGLVADCITDLHAPAVEAGVTVNVDLEPAVARGDAGLLERMIANLIDNGMRHNERDGHLDVSTRTGDGHVTLVVANGGPVIDPGQAQALLEPFRRLDRSFGGFGLGLSIVKSVVDAHHGTTEISAPPEGGLKLQIRLPAAPAKANVVVARTPGALTKS